VLFVVVAGLQRTGAMTRLLQPVMGLPRGLLGAQVRTLPLVALLSAFLNNTPIVAMFMPVMVEWGRRIGISPARLLLPLSYASIFGGICTLVGTSTNLVLHGLMLQKGMPGLSMFTPIWIGLPLLIVGMAYIFLASSRLLPDRQKQTPLTEDPRLYTAEVVIEPDGPLVGKTIEQAGLRHLQGLFVVELDRRGQVMAAVGPEQLLEANDRLVLAAVDCVRPPIRFSRFKGRRLSVRSSRRWFPPPTRWWAGRSVKGDFATCTTRRSLPFRVRASVSGRK